MIQSTFNDQLKILETEFIGNITAQHIIDYLIDFKTNISYPRKLKIISDANLANFKFSFEDLKSFNNEKSKSLERYDL